IESHSKHGDSIFWEGDGTLFVNLYIPADAEWKAKGAAFTLDTAYPFEGDARLTFTQVGRSAPFTVALRIPGWANGMFDIKVNGKPEKASVQNGYALVRRSWHKGDTVALSLPLELRMESAPGDKD